MKGSTSPVCDNCKPGKATEEREEAVAKLDCQATYDVVAQCMEAHRGNVADCRTEWSEFRSCHHEQQKRLKGGKA